MLIWFILAIALVVIALGGFAGRRRRYSTAEPTKSHHGKDAHNHRGRGRGH
jgi:hypothetical protein